MAKRFYEELREALIEVREIVAGRADPSTYRVHVPDPVTGRLVHVPAMRINPPSRTESSERAVNALAERRRRRRRSLTQTALFANLYIKRHGVLQKSDADADV